MPGKSFTYEGYALTPDNGVYVSEVEEMSGPRRALTILGQAGYRGDKTLKSMDGSKAITLRGIIYKNTEADFIAAVQAFINAMMNEGANTIPSGVLQERNSVDTYAYEDAIVTNTDSIFPAEQPYNINWIPFTLTFLAPKGFARSITQTQVTFSNITTNPLSSSITIASGANPEPVIILNFITHTTITSVTFLNSTTNESITISGLTIVDGDMLTIDTAAKTVMQNTTVVRYTGVMPTFVAGLNNFTVSFAGASSLVASQESYDSARPVYGANWVAQLFQIGGSPLSITQIALTVQRITSQALNPYGDFSSIDSSLWNTSGFVTAQGQRLRLWNRNGGTNYTSQADTSGKTGPTPPGQPVTGFEVVLGGHSNLNDGLEWEIGITDGAQKLWFVYGGSTGNMVIRQSGGYYGSTTDLSGQFTVPSSIKVIPAGGDIQFYADGVLVLTLTGKTIQSNSYFIAKAYRSSGSDSSDSYFELASVSLLTVSADNSDLTVRIETDTAGHPSGSIVTNGSLTIAASLIGTNAFSKIIAAFASSVSLSATTNYHLVIKQSGGDINNYYLVKAFSAGAYGSGNSETTVNSGGSWTQQTAEDLFFEVYASLPSGFTVGLEIDYYPSKYTVV